MKIFENKIEVRWSDCDPNRHVRHSAYYDYGAHSRIRFFASMGFDSKMMETLNIGPVIFKEECSFLKEIRIEDTLTINLLKGAINEDGSRWEFHHEIFNSKKEKSAHLTLKGAWMDLAARKLTKPPKELTAAIFQLKEGNPFSYKSKTT